MKLLGGFTIIELIVVIAIITVLAAIVAVNVLIYIQKAKESSTNANINSLMKAGIIHFSENGSYSNFFNTSGYANPKDAIVKIYDDPIPTERLNSPPNAWCACYGFKDESGSEKRTLCIDSSGYNKVMFYNQNCNWRCQTNGACQD